jgi:segregation and condensation protein B
MSDELVPDATAQLPEELRVIEAVVLCALDPVPPRLLAELLERPLEAVEAACRALAAAYEREGRGFRLVRVAGGYRFETAPDLAPYLERFATREASPRLSAAALEALAIVAYRQPVSRGQVAALRGVNSDGVLRLLEQRGYIQPVGRAPGPGQAVLYGTTQRFLEALGIDSLADLPPVGDLLEGSPGSPGPAGSRGQGRSEGGGRSKEPSDGGVQHQSDADSCWSFGQDATGTGNANGGSAGDA